MKLPHFSLMLVFLLLAAYVIGARWPSLAQMVKLA